LKIYHEQTEPLKGYYAERGILQTVDATKGIAEVTGDVLRSVGEIGEKA
jgi:adenylate kinase